MSYNPTVTPLTIDSTPSATPDKPTPRGDAKPTTPRASDFDLVMSPSSSTPFSSIGSPVVPSATSSFTSATSSTQKSETHPVTKRSPSKIFFDMFTSDSSSVPPPAPVSSNNSTTSSTNPTTPLSSVAESKNPFEADFDAPQTKREASFSDFAFVEPQGNNVANNTNNTTNDAPVNTDNTLQRTESSDINNSTNNPNNNNNNNINSAPVVPYNSYCISTNTNTNFVVLLKSPTSPNTLIMISTDLVLATVTVFLLNNY